MHLDLAQAQLALLEKDSNTTMREASVIGRPVTIKQAKARPMQKIVHIVIQTVAISQPSLGNYSYSSIRFFKAMY